MSPPSLAGSGDQAPTDQQAIHVRVWRFRTTTMHSDRVFRLPVLCGLHIRETVD